MPKKNKIISFLLCFCLLFEQSGFAQIAGELDISGHIAAFHNSFVQNKFRPLHLRYLQYDPRLNDFKILLDKGSAKNLSNPFIENSTQILLQYFLVGISLPNDAFWVNLRPDSPDNIIDSLLGQTDVGKVLLEADVQLKKDTARFTSPETPEGKEYWDKLYVKAGELFGNQNVTIPTLTRPWIVPGEIILRETSDNAYIYKATLKVMLEDDYLKGSAIYNFNDERLKELNTYASGVLREKIIPKLIQEVNVSKKYAALRQVYYSLILAQWFKEKFHGKTGSYANLIDKKEIKGLISKEVWSKSTYFQQYQKSFNNGEYNFKIPVSTPYGQVIRSYFSGGIAFGGTTGISALTQKIKGGAENFYNLMVTRGGHFSGYKGTEKSGAVVDVSDLVPFDSIWSQSSPLTISSDHLLILKDSRMGPDFRTPEIRFISEEQMLIISPGTNVYRNGHRVLIVNKYWQRLTTSQQLNILMHEAMADLLERRNIPADDIPMMIEGLLKDGAGLTRPEDQIRGAAHQGVDIDVSFSGEDREADEVFRNNRVIIKDGWRPLASSVSVIREILNSGNNFNDQYYLGWFEDEVFRSEAKKLIEGENVKPTRINTYIANQSAYVEQALVELIANAQDATIGQKRIGRFGVGAYQMFQEIKTPNDSIVVTTSTDGLTAFRLTFKLIDGQLCYKLEIVKENVHKGTQIQVNTKLSDAEVSSKVEYAERKFKTNSRGRVIVNGRQINNTSRYRYINGDALSMPEGEPVEIRVDTNGYTVIDKGSGMGPRTLFEKFLVPKGSTNSLEGSPIEKDAEVQRETKIFYSEPSLEDVSGVISIQVSGVVIVDIPIHGVNIPKEMIIELPHDTWLPESRDKVSFDDLTARKGLIAILNKITDLSRTDIKDRYCLLNAFALLIKALENESADRQLFAEARKLCDNLIHAERKAGKIILPNRKEFKVLASKQGAEVIFLDESLYDFMPYCLPEAKYISNFSSRTHTLYIADLDTDNGNDVYLEGRYPNGKGWIILDRSIYNKHEGNPWLVNLLLNFSMGYGDEGNQWGTIVIKQQDSKSESAVTASNGIPIRTTVFGEGAINDAEVSAIMASIFTSAMIQKFLAMFDEQDAELIRRKTEEAVRSGFVNTENAAEMQENLRKWLSLLIELKNLLPESVFTGKWIRDEFFATYFQVFGEKAGIRSQVQMVNEKAYFCCYGPDSKDRWFEMDKTGKIVFLGEGRKIVVLDEQVYLTEKDSSGKFSKLLIRKDGKNEIIIENALLISIPSNKQNKEIIVLTDEGQRVGVKVVEEGKALNFCVIDKDLAEKLKGDWSYLDLIKRGGYIYVVDRFSKFGFSLKDVYRIDSAGNVNKFTPGKPYDFDHSLIDKCGVADIKVLPDGSFVIVGESSLFSWAMDGKSPFSGKTKYNILVFDKDAQFKYSALETYNNRPTVFESNGSVFFQDGKELKCINQNGELETYNKQMAWESKGGMFVQNYQDQGPVPIDRELFNFLDQEEVVDVQKTTEAYFVLLASAQLLRISIKDGSYTVFMGDFRQQQLVRLGDDFFYVPSSKPGAAAIITKIDKDGHINEFVIDSTGNNFLTGLYSDGRAIFITLISRSNGEEGPREMQLIRIDVNGEKQVLFKLSGYVPSSVAPGINNPDSYIFSRAYDRMTYEADYKLAQESGEGSLFGEYFIFNIKTGEVTKIAIPDRNFSLKRDDGSGKSYINGNNVFYLDSSGLMVLPSINLMLNRVGILSKNLELLRGGLNRIRGLIGLLNAEERAKMLMSMAAYDGWMPAFIFLKDNTIYGHDLGPLKETFNVLLESSDIKEIRQRFAFVNFVFSKVKDTDLAVRIIQRWSKILVKNQELAEVIAKGLKKEFDFKTPLEFTGNSDDITKLPLDIQLYLKFLLSDELKTPQILPQESFKGERHKRRIFNRDLAALLRLREKFPDIARVDVNWDAVIGNIPGIDDSQLDGIRRDITGAVNGQDKTHFYWIRELVQNARDAIRDSLGIETKSGFLGHGFYTVFAGKSNQIRIRTGNGKETNELILNPLYDSKGDLLLVEVAQMNNYKSEFKGTLIQRVNFCSSQADDEAIIGMLYAFSQARRFLGSVPSKGGSGVTILFNGEIINEDGYKNPDDDRVIKINSGMSAEPNSQGFYEWVMSVEDPVGMDLYTILNKLLPPDVSGKPEQLPKNIREIGRGMYSSFSPESIQRVNVDNLYVDAIDYKYTVFIPQPVLDILLSRGWGIEFPQGTPVPRTRNSVIGVEKFAPWIAVLAFKTLIQLYLTDKDIELSGLGLPKDYIYSKDNAITTESYIEQDANLINAGSPEQVDFNKYMHNPHALIQLLTLVDIEFEGKLMSLSAIKKRVLEEYNKDSSSVDLGEVLPSGIEHLRSQAENYIKGAKGQKVNIDVIKNETLIIAIKKLSVILNGLLGVEGNTTDFVCEFNANYGAKGGKGRIIWNLSSYTNNLLPVLNFLVKGSTGNDFSRFIQTYVHEIGHSVEDSFREQYHNAWTHQAEQELEGSLGWIMKRLLTKMIGNLGSTDALREEILQETGFSAEEVEASYNKIVALINAASPKKVDSEQADNPADRGFSGGVNEISNRDFNDAWQNGEEAPISSEHLKVLQDPAMGSEFKVPQVRLVSKEKMDSVAKGENVVRVGNKVLIIDAYWNLLSEEEKLDVLMHEGMADWLERERPGMNPEDAPIDLEGIKKSEAERRARHKGEISPEQNKTVQQDESAAGRVIGNDGVQRIVQLEELRRKIEDNQLKRVGMFGDQHGQNGVLRKLVKAVEDGQLDEVIGHGDAFDRGNENVENFEALKRLKEILGDKAHFCFGNHDIWLIQALLLNNKGAFLGWYGQGGSKLLYEFKKKGVDPRELAVWLLQNCKLFHVDERGVMHVHAGIPLNTGGSPRISREQLEVWQQELESIQSEIKKDPNFLENAQNRKRVESLFKKAEPIFWVRGNAWIDKLLNRSQADKVKIDKFLEELDINGVVFGHEWKSRPMNLDNRIFCIDVHNGENGFLVVDKEGIKFNVETRQEEKLLVSKDAVIRDIDERLSRIQKADEDIVDSNVLTDFKNTGKKNSFSRERDDLGKEFDETMAVELAKEEKSNNLIPWNMKRTLESISIKEVFLVDTAPGSGKTYMAVSAEGDRFLIFMNEEGQIIGIALKPGNVNDFGFFEMNPSSLGDKFRLLPSMVHPILESKIRPVFEQARRGAVSILDKTEEWQGATFLPLVNLYYNSKELRADFINNAVIRKLVRELGPQVFAAGAREVFLIMHPYYRDNADGIAMGGKTFYSLHTFKARSSFPLHYQGIVCHEFAHELYKVLDQAKKREIVKYFLGERQSLAQIIKARYVHNEGENLVNEMIAFIVGSLVKGFLFVPLQDSNLKMNRGPIKAKDIEVLINAGFLPIEFALSVEEKNKSVVNEGNITSEYLERISFLVWAGGWREGAGFEGILGEIDKAVFEDVWQKGQSVEISDAHKEVLRDPAMGFQFRLPQVRLVSKEKMDVIVQGHNVVPLGDRVLIVDSYWDSCSEAEKLDILMHEGMEDWLERERLDMTAEDAAIDLEGLKRNEVERRISHKSDSPVKSTNIPILGAEKDKKGGIDFRALPIINQPVNTAALKLSTVDLNRLNNINLDMELAQIQNMVNVGIIPSNQRIKEYLLACCLKQGLVREREKILGCVADIMRLEEDCVVDTDVELKDILILVEAGKLGNEFQLDLIKIKISSQEPELTVL